MAFDPTCLPALPTCPDDMVAWSEDLISCLTTNFAAAFDQIGTISVPPFEICDEIGLLGENCMVPATGIDQSQFSYATDPDDVIAGNGILPMPTQAGQINYRAGAAIINSGSWNSPGGQWITLSPPMVANNYAILLSRGSNPEFAVRLDADQPTNPNGFNINVRPWSPTVGEDQNLWVYWLAIAFR